MEGRHRAEFERPAFVGPRSAETDVFRLPSSVQDPDVLSRIRREVPELEAFLRQHSDHWQELFLVGVA